MTRVHVRLLGPCFKTGPKSTQSSSVADRYPSPVRETFAGLSKDLNPYFNQQRARTGDGAKSVTSEYRGRALATASTHRVEVRPDTLRVPPSSRPGDRGFVACRFTGDATVTAPGP